MEMKKRAHPYMPNSVESTKKEMLEALNVEKIEDLYTYIPDELRVKNDLKLPKPFLSEIGLKKHVNGILSKNVSCEENINFLGAGCYQHYVPAICDEINSRSEFLTAYCGGTYSDHGKLQAMFEFTSMMGELVDMDVVALSTYDRGQAISTSWRMSHRITNRENILVPETMDPAIYSQSKSYNSFMNIIKIKCNMETGEMNLEDLKNKIDENTSAVFIENPSYLGFVETNGKEISKIAHENNSIFIVAADPSSLGVLEAPANYGADITCGSIQPLGMHMAYGSGLGGYVASHNKPEYILNFPLHFYGLYENEKGEFGFTRSLNYRTSYGSREKAVEYLGTSTGLWAITAAVYLALMGPEGMYELGENIISKSKYAVKRLSEVEGINIEFKNSFNFKEFVLSFDNKKVNEINKLLLEKGIFGGKDISGEIEGLNNSALYCITELTEKEDIDRLAMELDSILNS